MAEDEDNEVPAMPAQGGPFGHINPNAGLLAFNPQMMHQMGQMMPMLDNNALQNIQAQLQQHAEAQAALQAAAQQNGEQQADQQNGQQGDDEDMV